MMTIAKKSSFRLLKLSAAVAVALGVQTAVVNAQQVSDTGTGTAVFVPYYTINNGWKTLVNITNTSANSLVVKFRLHEARNSRDVLDFLVLLSPYDVWSSWVQAGDDGRPTLNTDDRSCTVPIAVRNDGTKASELAYSGVFVDYSATNNSIPRMSEGYIEVLVEGETAGEGTAATVSTRGSTSWYAAHVDGEPRDCNFIQNDFIRRTPTWGGTPADAIPGTLGSGSPLAYLGSVSSIVFQGDPAGTPSTVGYGPIATPAPLKVNVSLVNRDQGMAGGIESLHIAQWGVGQTLVTAQQYPWFLEPSLASHGGLWSTGGLTAINDDIAAYSVANEWTNLPSTGALANWVVTFPTKRFQTDVDAANIQAACNVWRNAASGGGASAGVGAVGPVWDGWAPATRPNQLTGVACPDLNFPAVFQEDNNGVSELVVRYDIYDREEGQVTVTVDGPVVSPAPPPDITIDNLRYEVNVLTIGRDAANVPSALDSLIALAIDTSQLKSGSDNGWLQMSYLDEGEPTNYATTGFIFKARNFGNPSLNFGQATEHAYTRTPPVTTTPQ